MIKINDKYYIDADTRNYTLKEKTTIKNKEGVESEGYRDLGFYTTLDSLLNGLIKTELRAFISESDNESIEELLRKLKELERFFREELKEV